MNVELPQESPKPICVVVDTNIWRAQPLLKTPLGETLVYTLSRRGGVLGLPEVVELELKEQIVQAGLEAIEQLRGPSNRLGTIIDIPFVVPDLPTADTLGRKVDERLAQLHPLLVREPLTIEHAKAALAMVNAKVPPNGDKNQQFKDSAIWQAVLALSLRYSTVLLTSDKGFFRDRDVGKGLLAENLVQDCTSADTDVKIYSEIRTYLDAVQGEEPHFDRDRARELIIPVAIQQLKLEAKRYPVVMTDLLEFSISAFATEIPDRLAIDYALTFKLEWDSPGHRTPVGMPDRGIVHGSAYFLRKENGLADHYVQRVALKGHGSLYARSFKDYEGKYAFPRPLCWD